MAQRVMNARTRPSGRNRNMAHSGSVIDKVEQMATNAILNNPNQYQLVDAPLEHRFTPGLYSRQITMPEGVLVTSESHKTEHQYILSQGIVSVWTEDEGEVLISAPFHGITVPGTRRVLYIHPEGGDAIWTTFHSTLLQTVEEIHDEIIEKCENPLMNGHYENNVFIPNNHHLK